MFVSFFMFYQESGNCPAIRLVWSLCNSDGIVQTSLHPILPVKIGRKGGGRGEGRGGGREEGKEKKTNWARKRQEGGLINVN